MKKKIIVAHPGKQHSFRIAEALKKKGILFKYITTVYYKENSFTNYVMNFLKGDDLKRAKTRKSKVLYDNDIIQFNELAGLILILLRKIDKKRIVYNNWENMIRKSFEIKVAKYGIKNNVDAIIVYDTNALYIGRYLKKKQSNIILIMDVAAANREYMKMIYEHDRLICPTFSEKLFQERKELWNKKTLEKLKEEISYIDYFLAPSQFVKKSLLIDNRIRTEQIYICPFGSNFPISQPHYNNDTQLNLVYIGNVTAMKGIWYLLEALMSFPKNKVSLKIIGNYDNSTGIFDKYLDRCEFTGIVTHDKIQKMCKNADVFVFPSLGEGMSLAAIEALSMGLPCIVTENSGINDFIINGENGFVIPIESTEAIIEKINWFLENKECIPSMKKNAIKTAQQLTWENYEYRVGEIINEIFMNN